jgi:hypothetical protein
MHALHALAALPPLWRGDARVDAVAAFSLALWCMLRGVSALAAQSTAARPVPEWHGVHRGGGSGVDAFLLQALQLCHTVLLSCRAWHVQQAAELHLDHSFWAQLLQLVHARQAAHSHCCSHTCVAQSLMWQLRKCLLTLPSACLRPSGQLSVYQMNARQRQRQEQAGSCIEPGFLSALFCNDDAHGCSSCTGCGSIATHAACDSAEETACLSGQHEYLSGTLKEHTLLCAFAWAAAAALQLLASGGTAILGCMAGAPTRTTPRKCTASVKYLWQRLG